MNKATRRQVSNCREKGIQRRENPGAYMIKDQGITPGLGVIRWATELAITGLYEAGKGNR